MRVLKLQRGKSEPAWFDFFVYVTTGRIITAWVWRCLLAYVFFTAGPVPRVRLMGHWLPNSSTAAPLPSTGLSELPSIMHAARQRQVIILLWAVAVFSVIHWLGVWVGFRRFGEEVNLLPLPGFEPRIVQPVTYSVYRLRCRGSGLP
jgi:hypothetical protein